MGKKLSTASASRCPCCSARPEPGLRERAASTRATGRSSSARSGPGPGWRGPPPPRARPPAKKRNIGPTASLRAAKPRLRRISLAAPADKTGKKDVTPRGDPPGSFKVLDEKTIAIADRPGNNRLDTLKNLL